LCDILGTDFVTLGSLRDGLWSFVRRGRRAADGARGPDPTFARLFARFAITGLVAMLVIGVFSFVVVRRSATSNVIRQAKELTQLAGRGIAQPVITEGVIRGVPADLARLDRIVQHRILSGTPIVRVKIWDERGRIVYSDDSRLVGSTFALGPDELRVLRDGGVEADASDLNRPENRFYRRFKRLVEVYVGIRGPNGSRLLYEDYERSSTISASSRRQWTGLLPALLGALLVLYLIQVPLAYSLGQRLRARQREREELLRRAIDASDLERRRIAADLHDGAVQRLAGVSLSLSAAAAGRGTIEGSGRLSVAVAAAASETRETIRELRTLLVDIYPPTLHRAGLPAALNDLVAPLQATGVSVSLRFPGSVQLSDDIEALFYRVAQEAIRNAKSHGAPTEVAVCVESESRQVVLSVVDNGRGFLADADGPHVSDGHFGLQLMHDLVDHAGGRLTVISAPGEGASVRVTVPLR
jgi:two-component system NarL family sensor kinase